MDVKQQIFSKIDKVFGSSVWNEFLEDFASASADINPLCDFLTANPQICPSCGEQCSYMTTLGEKLRESFAGDI